MSDIAQIVRTMRISNGLSQHKLDTLAGVPIGTTNNIEHGRHSPNIETVLKIMRACDYEIVFKPKYHAMKRR